MQKTAPKPSSLAIMTIFALSCAGILIFLWVSFGGDIPLAPNPYELKAAFPQAINVAPNADVRIAGVTVGHVRSEKLDEREHRTLMTLSIDRQFAPVPVGTRAILRRKTILGETYVELTPGPPGGRKLPDGGRLANTQVQSTVELDQILSVFDPQTKQLFRELVQNGARVLRGRGQDVSNALGNLPEFAGTGSALLGVLHRHSVALRGLVRNTGTVFAALNRRSGELQQLIVNSDHLFSATQQERGSLATIFEIFPTFLDESRTTLARLRTFSANADPVVNALKPVADALRPVLPDARGLSAPLDRLFSVIPPLVHAARPNLPQAVRFLRGLPPLLKGVNAFLPELNPILSFANWQQHVFGQFISGPGSGVAPLPPLSPGGPMRH
jgi:phospholipid/cholesterol/gamma-HCH transport system substrate-binding protein